MKQVICGSLSGMRLRQPLLQPYIPGQGRRSHGRHSGWELELGIAEQSQARGAVDCRETDQGDEREEVVVGNACGGKPSSHGSKAILLSHAKGVEPSP